LAHFRFGSLADIRARIRDVRFTPKSGHQEDVVGWTTFFNQPTNTSHISDLISASLRPERAGQLSDCRDSPRSPNPTCRLDCLYWNGLDIDNKDSLRAPDLRALSAFCLYCLCCLYCWKYRGLETSAASSRRSERDRRPTPTALYPLCAGGTASGYRIGARLSLTERELGRAIDGNGDHLCSERLPRLNNPFGRLREYIRLGRGAAACPSGLRRIPYARDAMG
jgi:hypothetical protein